MGVAEMTRFGFGPEEFGRTAELIAACLKGKNVKKEASMLRASFQELRYAFDGDEALSGLMQRLSDRY